MDPQRHVRALTSSSTALVRGLFVAGRGARWKQHLPYAASMGSAFSAVLLASGMQRTQPAASVPIPETSAVEVAALVEPAVIDEQPQAVLNPVTRAYAADGYFTGIQSSMVVPQPTAVVYDSLSKDLQHIFGPIQECKDNITEDDGRGCQRLQRDVQIPFTISYFSGCIKLKLDVENNRPMGQIHFDSLTQGRFLSKFIATFHIKPMQGVDGSENTSVQLDARIVVKKLPPPPLKNLVKGVVVRKMDRCMRDLAEYHSGQPRRAATEPAAALGASLQPQVVNNIQPGARLNRLLSTQQRDQRHSIL